MLRLRTDIAELKVLDEGFSILGRRTPAQSREARIRGVGTTCSKAVTHQQRPVSDSCARKKRGGAQQSAKVNDLHATVGEVKLLLMLCQVLLLERPCGGDQLLLTRRTALVVALVIQRSQLTNKRLAEVGKLQAELEMSM